MPDTPKPPRAVGIGRSVSALVVAALLADGAMQLFAPAKIASMMKETGFAMGLAPTLGGVMVACAILVTGFLGGAICAHVRLGELGSPPEVISLLLGVMTWSGLYLRYPRIRAILTVSREAHHCC